MPAASGIIASSTNNAVNSMSFRPPAIPDHGPPPASPVPFLLLLPLGDGVNIGEPEIEDSVGDAAVADRDSARVGAIVGVSDDDTLVAVAE